MSPRGPNPKMLVFRWDFKHFEISGNFRFWAPRGQNTWFYNRNLYSLRPFSKIRFWVLGHSRWHQVLRLGGRKCSALCNFPFHSQPQFREPIKQGLWEKLILTLAVGAFKFLLKCCLKLMILSFYVPARAKSQNVGFPLRFLTFLNLC